MTTLHEVAAALQHPEARLKHFASLNHEERCQAIRRMALDGHSAYGIATATGVSIEQVEEILHEELGIERRPTDA